MSIDTTKHFRDEKPTAEEIFRGFPTTPFQRRAYGIATLMKRGVKFTFSPMERAGLYVTSDLMVEIAKTAEWHSADTKDEQSLSFTTLEGFLNYFENAEEKQAVGPLRICYADICGIAPKNPMEIPFGDEAVRVSVYRI